MAPGASVVVSLFQEWFRPFRARRWMVAVSPGRCPGLYCCGPFRAKSCHPNPLPMRSAREPSLSLLSELTYDLCEANIWLHRTPYAGPRTPPARSPLLLKDSRQVRVMAPMGKPNPRLPLLGLMALVKNH